MRPPNVNWYKSLTMLLVWLLILPGLAWSKPVNLELVLAIDTSTSVDNREYRLQKSGLAAAFRDATVIAAIRSLGPNGIAVAVVQWAGAGQQIQAVKWTQITDRKSASLFANNIELMPRQLTGFTDLAGAISFSRKSLLSNRFDGRRMTIDVSGDGTSDRTDPAVERDKAIEQGITINGLLIYSVEYDLGDLARIALLEHYSDRVIGGNAAFVVEADSFREFAVAIRRKLIREIAGPLFSFKVEKRLD